jgi:hypothetical protein
MSISSNHLHFNEALIRLQKLSGNFFFQMIFFPLEFHETNWLQQIGRLHLPLNIIPPNFSFSRVWTIFHILLYTSSNLLLHFNEVLVSLQKLTENVFLHDFPPCISLKPNFVELIATDSTITSGKPHSGGIVHRFEKTREKL